MNGSRDLACEHIRTALGFEHTGVAVVLSGAIADRAVLFLHAARHHSFKQLGQKVALRKRPRRFLEKVECSGTSPSSPNRQNQR
jgi:hypothetical protein